MSDLLQRIAKLSPEKQALLKLRLAREQEAKSRPLKIPKRSRQERECYPVSFAQQRMWFQDRLGLKSAIANNISAALTITGPLQISALDRALQTIVQRHEILRTTLETVDGGLMQKIAAAIDWRLPVVDLRSLDPLQREERARSQALQQACEPVDLARDWCWRAELLHLEPQSYILLLTFHHIAVDAWSIGIFFRELSALYGAFASGHPSPLPALPIQYADFAAWQRQYFQGDSVADELAYWTQTLKNAPTLLQLPSSRPRPPVQSFVGKTRSFSLSQPLTAGLKHLSGQEGTTLYTTLLAGLSALLFRYSGQEDLLIGSPVANRHQPEVESLIGCFINTLVFRTNLSGNPSFRQLVSRVKETVIGALAHQTLPFETLIGELQPTRNVAYAPLFQVMLVLQNAFSIENIELPGLEVNHARTDNQTAQFDLTFHMVETDDGLLSKLEYNTDLFDEAMMVRLLGHFQTLLEGAIANPDLSLLDLPLLTPSEREQRWRWQQFQPPVCRYASIHQGFEARVRETPDAIALICADESLSYRALDRRVNQLARYLQKQGVARETRVILCVERSIAMLVGLLGILKAGGAYIPLEPACPPQRRDAILTDARPPLIVTQASLAGEFASAPAATILLDTDWEQIARESPEPLTNTVRGEDLAYIIYTSGSTGAPKGVQIEHRSLVNFTEAAIESYEISERDRVLQFATLSFDTAAEEIFPCLSQGATLILRTERLLGPMADFLKTCRDWQISVLDLPTAFWHQLVAEMSEQKLALPDCVRLTIIGGEKARRDCLALWQQQVASPVRLVNSYGPTEGTVVSTIIDLTAFPLDQRELPIGKAIRGCETYVLDARLNPLPIGIPGELYIGGAGVARGYLNRPDLTEQAFIPHPGNSQPGARLYKTGDRVCFREDGLLEFLGRSDNQVQIRGYRVELGEIETALSQHPDLQTSVVILSKDAREEERLVGYIVPQVNRQLTAPQLRRFLEKRLPKYMIPAAFVELATLPLTERGKIDCDALPPPEAGCLDLTETFVPPQTKWEIEIAAIFAEILDLDRVGLDDDFFELGGHSLLATKLLARLANLLPVELSLVDLFESPTVAGLVARLEKPTSPTTDNTIDRVQAPLDLEAKAVLDPDIIPPNSANYQWKSRPNQIFLTGGTGFLGAFLLAELLQDRQATVSCLVRASDREIGLQKIRDNLQSYQLWDEAFSDRIVAVPGDLALPRLGLTTPQFQELAAKIEVIYHNGALVNSIYPYAALESINVLGTQEILRLAAQTQLKAVHFVSSLSVVYSPDYLDREIVTEEDSSDRWQGLFNGYAQSKWVAEQQVKIAIARGIPACIYRPGVISGHSTTGFGNSTDFLHTLLQAFIQLKSAPALDAVWDLTPVDYVSRAIVCLSQQPKSCGKVFHLTNPAPISLNELIAALNLLGYSIATLSYEVWHSRLVDFLKQSSSPQGEALLSIFPQHFSEELLQVLKIKFDCKNTIQGLDRAGIHCPPCDLKLLRCYLNQASKQG